MKFRIFSRIRYLKRARHRHGHGIHSPFLFRLITTVIEENGRQPEYIICKKLKFKVLDRLKEASTEHAIENSYLHYNLSPEKLYRKVELPFRFGKVVFRLIREFKPSCVASYGPAFGTNLALMGMADPGIGIYQMINDHFCGDLTRQLLRDLTLPNIHLFDEKEFPIINPGLILLNHPYSPELNRRIVTRKLENAGDDDVLIVRGIHESDEMEALWFELTANHNVRVSLDLFEIGIALFRKGLQKENFIQRF